MSSCQIINNTTNSIIEIINSTTDVALEAPTVLNMSENIDDRIANLLIGGSGISINYDDSLNTITISNTYNDGLTTVTYNDLSNSNDETLNTKKRVAKSWINFNGTGVISIRDDFNIANVVDNGTGDYTINFSTPFTNTNYAFVAWARDFNNDVYVTSSLGSKSTSIKTKNSIRVIFNYLLNGINYDSSECNIIVFGG